MVITKMKILDTLEKIYNRHTYKKSNYDVPDSEIRAKLTSYMWGIRDSNTDNFDWEQVGVSIRLILNYEV